MFLISQGTLYLESRNGNRFTSGISKSNACVVAVGWLQRIPSDARMMKTHDRILFVTGPEEKWL